MPRAPACDIAVIGIACRFPGAASPGAFWQNLLAGTETITHFSDEELLAAGIDEGLLCDPHYVRAAPIIADHDGFDAAFFGYSPREARLMDPQQRHFLEVVWEAFEDAGYDPMGENGVVGIYAGAGGLVSSQMVRHDHPDLRGQTGDIGHIGNDRDFLPSRVAFKLDLKGPAVNVQTACSTSLVAVHLACRALLDGDAEVAVAGAAVVRIPHISGYLALPDGIDSPDGHCRPFDAQGRGTLFGSGVAAVVLKPLRKAMAHGDHVYAVIKGSAVTNDGAVKVNYTASTVSGQARAMTAALKAASVDPDGIGYVECHGTATALGDPIEIQALTRAFRAATERAQYCAVGSVKSNFGHLEQCAGLAGLIKTVLALDRGVVPPSLHCTEPNPRIPFARSPFFVSTGALPFPRTAAPRRAAVNSVGMGGTNAFLVLEEGPLPPPREKCRRPVFALALSAKSPAALARQAADYRELFVTDGAPELRDICFTANCGRHHFEHRYCAVGADRSEMAAALDRFLAKGARASSASEKPITFLYSGQGAQYLRMGAGLAREEPVFRVAFEGCLGLFEAEGLALRDTLFGADEVQLTRTLFAQPALFSLQIALTALWREWGIAPDIVIGHSVGEFAAAAAAGACTVEDAAHLVLARARLMEDLPERGGMASVAAGAETVRAILAQAGCEVAIAAENAPDRITISGADGALAAVVAECRRRDIPSAKLKTSHAFHSPLMEPMLEAFGAAAAGIAFAPPKIRWISTLTGADLIEPPDAGYWSRQIREPVSFCRAVENASRQSKNFLEVGPGSTLTALGRRCVPEGPAWLSSLKGRGEDWRDILETLGALYQQGRRVRWDAVGPTGGRRVPLPTYPFEHRQYRLEPQPPKNTAVEPAVPEPANPFHPLLGNRLGGEGANFEALLHPDDLAFLGDHRVFGQVTLPTAAILDAAMAAAERAGLAEPVVENLVYEQTLTLATEAPLWVMTSLEATGAQAAFRLQSTGMAADDPWRLHASGTIRGAAGPVSLPPFPFERKRAAEEIPADRFYRFLDATGLSYGQAFRGIRKLWRRPEEAFAEVALPAGLDRGDYHIHPAFLDACLHLYAALIPEYGRFDGPPPATEGAYVPLSLAAFRLFRRGCERAWVHAERVEQTEGDARFTLDIRIYGTDGAPVALLRNLTVHRVAAATFAADKAQGLAQFLYTLDWRHSPLREQRALSARHWCVLADRQGVGEHLVQQLTAEGATAEVLEAEAAALNRALDGAPQAPVGFVDLRALDMPPPDADDAASFGDRLARLCGGVLDLVQTLGQVRDRFAKPPLLWLATRSAETAPDQGALVGLGKSFALEYPEMWGGLVELPDASTPETAADLLRAELHARGCEHHIRYRGGDRLVPRLVRLADESRRAPPLAADATYWITGGFGRLGLAVADALIAAGARHVALTGRNPPDARTAEAIAELAGRAELRVVRADVGDETSLSAALAEIGATMPPLKGVVHLAAVFEDALLADADRALFDRVLRPKAIGAWNLHRATSGHILDFFVLFSSVLSLWGAAGQGAYAAANSVLDALAHYRRAQGLPATVFNWGPWEDAGRWGAVGAALWRQRATRALAPETCLQVLLSHLGGSPPQIVVTDTSWSEYLAQFAKAAALVRELAPAPAAQSPGNPSATPEDAIAEHAARVLGLAGNIDRARPLNELGLDSLLAVTLANRLRAVFDRAVPTAVLLKGPSVRQLAAGLFPEQRPAVDPPPAETAPAAVIAGNRWLVIHRPGPQAKIRLFAFPFAGGGAATFRAWADRLDPAIELVAVEPPGRQTRIDEPPLRDLDTLLDQLLPELLPFLDKPFAVYGHCLGALTLFEAVRRLMRVHQLTPAHIFVSGARPPDELQRQQDFEDSLAERLLQLPEYTLFEPIWRQPDAVFSEAIRRFNVPATQSLVQDAELRRLILPAIRAEFEMASNYRYQKEPPWDVPITCLTGTHDTYVSAENARSWARFTNRRFQLFTRDSEHFIVADDDKFLLHIINRELTDPV